MTVNDSEGYVQISSDGSGLYLITFYYSIVAPNLCKIDK